VSTYMIRRNADGKPSALVPVDAEPIIEGGEVIGYQLRHNAVLEGGPGHRQLMDLRTPILVWDSPWRPYDPGEYRVTDRTDPFGRAVYDWHPDPQET
jgi:hypothetical protein